MVQTFSAIRHKPTFAIALTLLSIVVISAARIATHTDLAASNPHIAALMFLWIVADALALTLIAKAPDFQPGLKAVLGAIALGFMIVPLAAAAPVRSALFEMPLVLTAMMLTVGTYVGWSGLKALSAFRSSRSIEAAFGEFLPPQFVHFVKSEIAMVYLGVFRWNAPADIPDGASAFAYHKYLTPMLISFLILQLIELAVVHLLVSMWSEKVAFVLLALSLWGVIWIIALTKSFRIFPILLTPTGVRVRSGTIVDQHISYDEIEGLENSFGTDELNGKGILNLAILSAPNVCIRLSRPLEITTFFGRTRSIDGVALRIDESAKFQSELERGLK